MYRNCVYNNKTKSVHLWTWDASGNRVFQELDFLPYLYLESKVGDATSIYGTAILKREFNTKWDRDKFVNESGIRRIFENLPPYQQFLIDNYYHCNEDEDFAAHPLKIMYFDIECPGVGAFPEPKLAENVINLLTCYDSLSKKYTVFGLKNYEPKEKNVKYHHCKSEEDLLKRFINHFSSDFPDCLVGWNTSGFDIPYLVNRITFQLGKEWADKLSPIERIYEKVNSTGKFGMPTTEYVIEGISCIDYMVLYKKFALEPQESYKLDYIGEVELDDQKVSYEGSLWDLSVKDWETYVDYNIQDVKLVVDLDEELKYLDLLRFIAYLGLCNLENAIKTVPVINGAVAIRARHRDEKIPTFVRPKTEGKIPGGYVAKPKLGFSQNVVSFDANSLYPSVMISLNMSPETKLGSLEKIGDIYSIKHVSGKTFDLSKENFVTFLKEEKASLSKANVLFSQKKVGIMPEFLDFLYTKRKEMKGKMFQAKKALENPKLSKKEISELKTQVKKFDTFQNAYKITLNSTYGYCANKYAPLGDDEIGSSVTLTGQAVIKKSNELFERFVGEFYPDLSGKCDNALIYNDTDSIYISMKLFEDAGIVLKDGEKISDDFFQLCDKFENYLNDGMNLWSVKSLLSKDSRFVFKRESICDNVIFVSGKNYVLHILDDEGMAVNKFKYKGVSVVKTTMPKAIKPYVKAIMETMVMSQSMATTNAKFMDAYEIFKGLDIDSIYMNCSMSDYDKHKPRMNGYVLTKGKPSVPNHVGAAHFHDTLVDELGISNKYEKFKSGDKVKRLYLKTPNKYGISVIGFKGKYPHEFSEIFEIDYEKMFGNLLYKSIEVFYKAVNWKLRKPNENVKIELEDFFS
jgi:DNA polymerase elongation subunit (family B)